MDVEQNMVAFETAMRWNGFNSPTRSSTGDGYTYARDADRFRGWELHRQSQALEIERLQAIEAAAKTVREASGVVLAAQIRTHGDGKTLSLPLPLEYATEMKAAMDAQAALYRLLDAGVLFNTDAQGRR